MSEQHDWRTIALALARSARKLVNNLPEREIELLRSEWGNTNTRCILEARRELQALLWTVPSEEADPHA